MQQVGGILPSGLQRVGVVIKQYTSMIDERRSMLLRPGRF